MLGGKPMIRWVYERASSIFEHLLVATDDQRIHQAVEKFGGKVQMTSSRHSSGTNRCAEAALIYEKQNGLRFTHVVNIQGDEPLIRPEQLQTLMDCFQSPETRIATLISQIKEKGELENPNVVKVVVDQSFRALYFSRAPIPFVRSTETKEVSGNLKFYKHIGLYAFQRQVLEHIVQLPLTALEKAESLEQLRWMEYGITIQTAFTDLPSLGVDTPEDLELIIKSGLI
jgi:3-deoxy-manno-octulosonate cytidylyltransferase (CMP-KDO synthetase)